MQRTVFCIQPAGEDGDALARIIERLAKAHGGPLFHPHLTLYTGWLHPDESAGAILAKVMATVGPILLEPAEIGVEELFTRSLLLRFRTTDELGALSRRLRRATRDPSDYQLDPHVSLAYTPPPLAERRAIADGLRPPKGPIGFRRAAAIATPSQVLSRTDVEAWRTLATVEMGDR